MNGELILQRYGNRSGNSGVRAFAIVAEGIAVQFGDHTYLYSWRKPGRAHVLEMRRLALTGRGLSSYISRKVGKGYDRKLD